MYPIANITEKRERERKGAILYAMASSSVVPPAHLEAVKDALAKTKSLGLASQKKVGLIQTA